MAVCAGDGHGADVQTLAALRMPVYPRACDDPRVVGLVVFSYNRRGGSRDYPALKSLYERIGRAILAHSTSDQDRTP